MNMYNIYDMLCVSDLWHDIFSNPHHFPRPLKVAESQRGDQKPNSKAFECEDPKTFLNGLLCL